MNLLFFTARIRVLYIFTIVFLALSIGMLVGFLTTQGQVRIYYLLSLCWLSSTTTLLFHYLMWKILPLAQKLDIASTSNYTFFLTLLVYILLFPLISIFTLVFLAIFTIAVLILSIFNLFNAKKNSHKNNDKGRKY